MSNRQGQFLQYEYIRTQCKRKPDTMRSDPGPLVSTCVRKGACTKLPRTPRESGQSIHW